MRAFSIFAAALIAGGALHSPVCGALSEQDKSIIRKMYSTIEMMKHELGNHEAELQTFTQKLENMEDAIEDIQRQLGESLERTQKKLSGTSSTFDTKISSQESTLKGLATDLQTLKSHANTSSSTLDSYERQITHLESVIAEQNKNLDDLKSAMKHMMGALGGDETTIDGYQTYQVKSGDSLGLIAQRNGTTIREIKELNNLKKDTIFIGQKLKIPTR